MKLIDEITNTGNDDVPPGGQEARTSGQGQLPPAGGEPVQQGCNNNLD